MPECPTSNTVPALVTFDFMDARRFFATASISAEPPAK